ncbi:MAG: ABC transporter ATP-binding protein [Anaerolineae bacterium]|nr:ABC transporter ATP-binding protein [Anaerolineae bacterium]
MIQIEGLTKEFGSLVAVDNVTLTVQPGEVLALLGPNGAGKTTTVRMLSAILKPTQGMARIDGYDVVTHARQIRERVGVLTEMPGLYTRMTGREYLDFFGEIRGFGKQKRQERIEYLADWFKMSFALDRRLGGYSKGMAQKIALIRTLIHNPPVLLLDEPTSAMDPQSARLVRNTILQMRGEDKRAIIICTHNLPEAEELADRIAIIRAGRIIAEGTLPALKAKMLGTPLMELRFTQPIHNGLVPLIAQYAQVHEVGADWVRYITDSPGVVNPRLLQALMQAGASILTLSQVKQNLESVYMHVVQDGVV